MNHNEFPSQDLVLAFFTVPFFMMLLAFGLRLQAEAITTPQTARTLAKVAKVLAIVATVFQFFLAFLGVGGILGFLFMVLILARWFYFENALRGLRLESQELELIWLMALATKSTRQLADEIEGYAASTERERQIRLLDFADDLRRGKSMRECFPRELFSHSVALQVQAAMNSPHFGETLSQLAIQRTSKMVERSRDPGQSIWAYPLFLIVTTLAVTTFLAFYIVPKFKKIFDDFSTELPLMTTIAMNISDLLTNLFPFALFGALALFLARWVIKLLFRSQIRNAIERYESPGITRFCKMFFMRAHAPDVLRGLGTTIASGSPLSEGSLIFRQQPASGIAQKQLEEFMLRVQRGEPCWSVLRSLNVLTSPEQRIIESAGQVGNLPWMLESLAENLERRWDFRWKVFGEFFRPLIIVFVSILFGFIAIAMFLPLIKLINDLS